ncbi:MAG: DNA repair protein RecO [bacterium]|nr:DNA repair protein RecO [bacterium]
MSYHVYTAKGIILRERPLKEADLSLKILTRELGLITAIATGLRKGNSKRRPPLTELSLSDVSLVRGKRDWRVTSASLEINAYNALKNNRKILLSVARALFLVENLVQGEEKHPELFNTLYEFITFGFTENLSGLEEIFESILVARILSKLGYLSEKEFPEIIFNDEVTKELFEKNITLNKSLILAINKGIRESGLIK